MHHETTPKNINKTNFFHFSRLFLETPHLPRPRLLHSHPLTNRLRLRSRNQPEHRLRNTSPSRRRQCPRFLRQLPLPCLSSCYRLARPKRDDTPHARRTELESRKYHPTRIIPHRTTLDPPPRSFVCIHSNGCRRHIYTEHATLASSIRNMCRFRWKHGLTSRQCVGEPESRESPSRSGSAAISAQ